jgi:hypothetical protein
MNGKLIRSRALRATLGAALLALGLGIPAGPAHAQASPGEVAYDIDFTGGRGGFTGTLDVDDMFGSAMTAIGDFDGNGVRDVVVGAMGDADQGALWELFLDTDSSVKSSRKISSQVGGFVGPPGGAGLGRSVACLGDLDGDGVVDLAAGGPWGDAGPVANSGVVWILFLNPDGTVRSQQAIGTATGGFGGTLHSHDYFGAALAPLGDVDGDDVVDLAVGAPEDGDGGFQTGAVWILFLHPDGTVKAQQKISSLQGGFLGDIDSGDEFGSGIEAIDDLDGDGIRELAAGAPLDYAGAGFGYPGAVWILFLASNGTVKSFHKIGAAEVPGLNTNQLFGFAVSTVGDLDGDGRRELAVGSPYANGYVGLVRILFLDETGAVTDAQKIGQFEGGFGGWLSGSGYFGWTMADVGDLDGDGAPDLMVGAPGSPSVTELEGDAWLLFLVRGPWTWLGNGLAGTAGVPQLVGTGTLVGGEPAALNLTEAAPSAAATLVIGLSALNAPFKGGVLVPLPAALVSALTDAGGTLPLAATWPAGLPSGLEIYLQYWIVDATAPHGFAASNAVLASAP